MRARITGPLFNTAAALLCATALHAQQPPTRDVPLVEKKWSELANRDISEIGGIALGMNRDKWRHAETPHFIVHFRRVTEAKKVVREIEYCLWYIAQALDAKPEQYARQSHVFVFQDLKEWQTFLPLSGAPQFASSFARGDELFLDVREDPQKGRFDFKTLAHETAHVVAARLYPGKRWPLWLGEGFAEYMAGASLAARKSQYLKGHQRDLHLADLTPGELEQIGSYPATQTELARLYQSSEQLVRFLMSELPGERFPAFVDAVLAGKKFADALMAVYGDELGDYEAFEKKYSRFKR